MIHHRCMEAATHHSSRNCYPSVRYNKNIPILGRLARYAWVIYFVAAFSRFVRVIVCNCCLVHPGNMQCLELSSAACVYFINIVIISFAVASYSSLIN